MIYYSRSHLPLPVYRNTTNTVTRSSVFRALLRTINSVGKQFVLLSYKQNNFSLFLFKKKISLEGNDRSFTNRLIDRLFAVLLLP